MKMQCNVCYHTQSNKRGRTTCTRCGVGGRLSIPIGEILVATMRAVGRSADHSAAAIRDLVRAGRVA